MKIVITIIAIMLFVGSFGGCSVVNSNQAFDNKANEKSVSKEKEAVWTHFTY